MVNQERALKPFLQLFITLDQKVCLIPELRFPIPTLLNKKKVIFLPPVDFFLKVPTAPCPTGHRYRTEPTQ